MYLEIKNKGEIFAEDIKLIGSSTKTGNSDKIGQFGSGWKYALAWIMRNNLDIKIFSGEKEILVSLKKVNHRNKTVNIIVIDGQETSITTEMGVIDWKAWMAVREIVSNAIDEGEDSVKLVEETNIFGEKDTVKVFIELNQELNFIVNNFDFYFSFNRVPNYTVGTMKIFVNPDDRKSIIYRKNIKCYDTHPSFLDLNFENIKINESRLSNHESLKESFKNEVKHLTDTKILILLLENFPVSWFDFIFEQENDILKRLAKEKIIIPLSAKTHLGSLVNGLVVPDVWYNILREKNLVEDVFSKLFGEKGNGDYYFLDTSDLNSELTLKLRKVIPTINIKVVQFVDESDIVAYDLENNLICISRSVSEIETPYIFSQIFYKLSQHNLRKFYEKNSNVLSDFTQFQL